MYVNPSIHVSFYECEGYNAGDRLPGAYTMAMLEVSAHSPKRRLMLSPLWVLRILSAIVGLMSIVTNLEHRA